MLELIFNLVLISLIVALVFMSGFWDYMDGWISKKVRFFHLPHLLMCGTCQTFWLSVLFCLITSNISLLSLVLCLVNANLNDIVLSLLGTLKTAIGKIIEILNRPLY